MVIYFEKFGSFIIKTYKNSLVQLKKM